ncbi:MAG: phage tail protein [Oscillospiraceae bacterium]|nr:phage tail protein [Oscillospiraceae bacterium]
MKPVLYSRDGTERIGVLNEATVCTAPEQRNGAYTASFTYPYVGEYFSQIEYDSMVRIKPNPMDEYQVFRVTGIGKTINGMVSYNLAHISYELNGNPILHVSVEGTAKEVLQAILNNTVIENHYVAESDITEVKKCEFDQMSAREAILKTQQYFGGELEWDRNSRVILHRDRGKDNGKVIAYGVDLLDYSSKLDISNIFTAIAPCVEVKGDDGEKVMYNLPEKILPYYNAENYTYIRAKPVDFTDEFTEEELAELGGEEAIISALRNKAYEYMQENSPNIISRNVTLSYVDLQKAKEFETIAAINDLCVCDYVTLKDDRLGVNIKAKVISVKFNAITEMYDSIEIGDPTDQLIDALASIVNFDNNSTTIGETIDNIEKNLDEYFSEIRVTDGQITFISGNIKNREGVYNKYIYKISRDTDIQEEDKKGKIVSFIDPQNRKTRIERK